MREARWVTCAAGGGIRHPRDEKAATRVPEEVEAHIRPVQPGN